MLQVEDLRVSFRTEEGEVKAVDGVSFSVEPGEILAVVGESGSGKSVTAMTLMGLTRSPNATFGGTAHFGGTELIGASEEQLRRIRGPEIAMIFQNPMTALNPVQRIGDQIVEQIRAHERVSRAAATERAVQLLARVGIPRPRELVRSYAHELSGGMRQRVMIGLALSCSPRLIIADEPTTALDVTIQAQILAELESLRADSDVSIILITHDLGVVSQVADRVLVMYGGRVVEQSDVDDLLDDPQHPYTWALLASVPRVDGEKPRRLASIAGSPPSLLRPPPGCHFSPRCPHRYDDCSNVPPLAAKLVAAPRHFDRCWLTAEDKLRLRSVDFERIGAK